MVGCLSKKVCVILTDEVLLEICVLKSPAEPRYAVHIISGIAAITDKIRIGELMCALTVGDNLLPELSRSVNKTARTSLLEKITRGEGELQL